MLQLSEEYAQKCYIFETTLTRNDIVAPRSLDWQLWVHPTLIDLNALQRDCASIKRRQTGIYIIYENIGFGRFNFQYHGDKATLEKFLGYSNLLKTDELDIQPANCNADNIRFGLQQVYTIRNTIPVRLINSKLTTDVGKPVISCYYNSPVSYCGKSYSIGVYCPPAGKVDECINRNEQELKFWISNLKEKYDQIRKTALKEKYDQIRRNEVFEKSKNNLKNSKQKKPTTLRSALRASGLKPEAAENSTEKTAENEVVKVEKPKCSKSMHQGNARTFKRKTKRSGRV